MNPLAKRLAKAGNIDSRQLGDRPSPVHLRPDVRLSAYPPRPTSAAAHQAGHGLVGVAVFCPCLGQSHLEFGYSLGVLGALGQVVQFVGSFFKSYNATRSSPLHEGTVSTDHRGSCVDPKVSGEQVVSNFFQIYRG